MVRIYISGFKTSREPISLHLKQIKNKLAHIKTLRGRRSKMNNKVLVIKILLKKFFRINYLLIHINTQFPYRVFFFRNKSYMQEFIIKEGDKIKKMLKSRDGSVPVPFYTQYYSPFIRLCTHCDMISLISVICIYISYLIFMACITV